MFLQQVQKFSEEIVLGFLDTVGSLAEFVRAPGAERIPLEAL
jgi:hypothetical protein